MKILWKCSCLPSEHELTVEDRQPTDDIGDWMEGVVRPMLTEAHQKASPLCTAGKVEYIKIPFAENSPGIGMKPILHG